MLGNMGWTSTRAKVLSITNAIYYAGRFFAMKADSPLTKVEIGDLKGHSFGTVTGFTIVPEMKKVPGTTDVKLYDTTDACIRDVVAGRLDYAMLDAPTVDYMILQVPAMGSNRFRWCMTRRSLSARGQGPLRAVRLNDAG